MVYFIRAESGGDIKIGTTRRLKQRLGALNSKHKCRFVVLAVLPGGYAKESEIHRQFRAFRTMGRDWYTADASLLEFIETHGQRWDGQNEGPKERPVLLPAEIAKRIKAAACCRSMTIHEYATQILDPFLRQDISEALDEFLGEEAEVSA